MKTATTTAILIATSLALGGANASSAPPAFGADFYKAEEERLMQSTPAARQKAVANFLRYAEPKAKGSEQGESEKPKQTPERKVEK